MCNEPLENKKTGKKEEKKIYHYPQHTDKNMHMLNTFITLLGESSDKAGLGIKTTVDMCPR